MTIADSSQRIAWALSALTGEEVLDVGCGNGDAALALARAGRQVSGAAAPECVREARAALYTEAEDVRSRARFLVVEGPLPFGDACFDAALLEDLDAESNGGLPALFLELRRVVRPGGLIAAWTAPHAMPGLLQAVEPLLEIEREERIGTRLALGSCARRRRFGRRRRITAGAAPLGDAGGPADDRTPRTDRDCLTGEVREHRRRADGLEVDGLVQLEAVKDEAGRLLLAADGGARRRRDGAGARRGGGWRACPGCARRSTRQAASSSSCARVSRTRSP